MLEKAPTNEEMIALIGQPLFEVWIKLCDLIESKYDMERLWNSGGKKWKYEHKYRRGGKSLCALYAKENVFGFMIIFGKDERAKFEADKNDYSLKVQKIYDESTTYHDGKWMMFELTDTSLFPDMEKLLLIKRKPNKK
ncbi:MAG: DUF3788 domain-containing protein [Syntrophomonadaceae bacterium]|nr:DUF3788 domain-containing protein [Syntrophomonadaceae bacterium]MDD3023293.1 DUF3788 domain-containing protein [Syntrophomonadaceae bacterium]